MISVAFGDQHACGLTDAGIVKCWGRNNHGQIGTSGGDKNTPVEVSFGSTLIATSIYAGGHHTCVILSDGTVRCWGRNVHGQLGIGTTINTNTPTTVNTLGAGRTAISLALAWDSTCALLDDGSVKCWGKREHGQLGDGLSTGETSSPPSSPVSFGAGRTAKMITAGEFHYCAILDNDEIMCWGDGANGKLATGSTSDQTTPTAPSGAFAAGRYAVYLDAGYHHTCAILDNGHATCWGSDANGQLGNVAAGDILTLHTGYLAWKAMAISAGGSHTCMQVDKPNDGHQHERIKCWGSRSSGQLGDNSAFGGPDATTPQSVFQGFTAFNTGITAPNYVNGATCEISPDLPAGLSLTSGDCAITGTPTVTAVNTTYTVWANITGQSFSGQFWLEVGLNAPIISYPQSLYTFTIDSEIVEIQPTNFGGEVTTWEIDPQSLPTGVNFGAANGTFWGTPTALETLSSHTVWANNSAGSDSFSISFTINDVAPSITYSEASLTLVANTAMAPLPVINTGGAIISCSELPSLPAGLSLSNTCEITGTPTVPTTNISYTITATNSGGTDSTSIYILVQSSGGSLTISPINTEGSVNNSISDITMTYTHAASSYGWSSGVTNGSSFLSGNLQHGDGSHWLGFDSGEQGEMAVVFARNDTGATTHNLALRYLWNGVWTEYLLDSDTDTGQHPSVAIDRQGALHIAYIDVHNNKLRYATNSSGIWAFTTLGDAIHVSGGGRGTAIVVHPITDSVHIVTTNHANGNHHLQYHTNEGGTWFNETITDTTKDEGYFPSMVVDGAGNLYVAHHCNAGCKDLRLSSRINGMWQIETVAGVANQYGMSTVDYDIGNTAEMAIDSQGTLHIVSQTSSKRIYLHSGTPGNWFENRNATTECCAHWPAVAVDSNDAVHIAYHIGTNKNLKYLTNASGSWSSPKVMDGYAGWGSVMEIDANDDIFIVSNAPNNYAIKLTTIQGSGQGLTASPIYDISPQLPDGLTMNWRTGTISGTPTEAHTNTTHTVTVTALGYTTTATFTLFITGAPGAIAYSDISGTKHTPITPITPTFTNTSTSGLIDTWEIYPNPPLGLNFGSSNGTIWGTPTVVQLTPITYTVWANNTGGSATATLEITIADNLASFSYPNSPHIIVRGYIMSDITPTVTSGTVVSWGIHPSLPSGLSFTNGVISGRPTVNQTTTIYTVYANNSGGSATAILELTINEPTPNIDYHPDNYTLTNNTAIRIDPILQADPPSGSGTLLTGTSIRMKYSCMHQIGDLIFFAGRDELPGAQTTTGDELWALNHTEAISATNPYLVKDINAGVGDSINNFCGATVHNDTLFFVANDGLEGYELWKSDGTNSGTQLVRSLYPGNQNSNPYGFFTIGDTLYFSARSTSAVHSIWKTDGTSAGTVQVSSGCNDYNCVFGGATEYNGNIYGNGYTPTGGVELFVMDGNSLQMLVDLNPGSNFNIPKHTNPQQLTVFNGLLYFETNGYNGQAIYRTDGTVAGTTQFLTGTTTQPMQIFNDELYFIHQGAGASGYELWKTDGTNVTLVKDVNPQPYGQTSGFCNSQANPVYSTCFTEFQVIGDYMLFVADSGSTGRELWITDGTTAGTRLLKDINPGATGSNPQKFYSMGDVVYFRADNGITGSELWRTDGTAVGTVLVNDIRSGSDGSAPGNFIDVDGELYFSSISTNGITGLYQVNNAANGIIGAPTTWTIWPSTLPNGLTFSNGVISGTPTDLQLTPTMYTITATNANGSSSTTINLTIIDAPPGTITYSPHDMVLTKNELMTPNVPTVTGDITTWETYPVNLPPGLNFGANNGTIWGTPSIILVSPITYTIWANNSGGSSTTTVNITINDQIPTITYSPSDYIFTVNDTISPSISPSISGGAITTWAINATLPNGVFFGPNNGTIYGMAGQLWPQHTYLITAANSGGKSSDYLNITIIDELPTSISYPVVNLNLTNNTASPDLPMSPQIQGPGVIISWEISGDLPQGLFFNVNTGEISGIATELWPTTDYTVWANNSGGSVIIEFNITVVDQLPTDITYNPSDLQLVNNTVSPDLPLIPQLNGPGQIIGWEINTSLPNGLNFGSDNGTIWGTPTELWPTTAYQVWANNTGGSVVGYLNITVVDQVPVLSYSPDIIELTNNTASLDLPLHSQLTGPGEITSWEISAGLPDGIFFGASNGTIWGTPTELWPAVSYTVWANNTGGSASASLTISVIDQVPTSITYAPSNLNLINNTASNDLPLNPQITGQGEITSWEISSGIPQGLTFDGNTGEISGIATELWPTTHYTIWANNTGGSVIIEMNITVVDQVPTLVYTPNDLQLMNNTVSSDLPLVPQLSGPGEILTWEINGSLPNGIGFGSNNGTFWGTPTELWPTTAYKVWANNSGGSAEGYLNVTVVDQIPLLVYSPDVLELINNTVSSDLPLSPTLSGAGIITSWDINGSLPSGISFGNNNGTIYGVSTELWPTTEYTVWANNSGGSTSTTLTITVVDQVPTGVIYPVTNLNLTNNTASSDLPLTPQITGPGSIISWAIIGQLPQGLVFDSNTGEVSGIATELWPTTSYTVWANNSGGSVEIEFNITVVDQLPSSFTYNPSDLLLSNNTASSDLPLVPQLTGPGAIISWSINETLPLGLNFGNNNGSIWGIPTELQLTPKPFNVTATNSGGSVYAIINITILEVAPSLDYNPDDYNFTRNVTITDIIPTYTPLNLIDTWEISPDVPLGLTFDNGTISGTPTVNMTRTEFTVWANNSGGSSSATFNITIVEPTGSFAYVPAYYNFTRGLGIAPISPGYTGGAIENWSIYPELPNGLIFNNGSITGTPMVNSTEVNYTVFANNSGGSVSAFISITINEPVASIIYAPDERNETRTISMTPWFPQVTGGEVETWQIHPDLPLGLTFIDGVISGTATVNSTRTNYTVWANNSGGSSSTNIYLTIVEPVVELSYSDYELILVRDVTMTPVVPQLSGGVAETWEIYPELPDGIVFDNGILSGTPTVNSTRSMYTVWANNTGGSNNVSLNITILEPSANIVYDPTNLILTRGESMQPAIPNIDGGAIESWSIYPDLPDGLVFDNGTISGTPTFNMTIANYLIYGNNSGGSSVVGLSITILEPAPTITYQDESLVLTRGEAMPAAIHAIFGGGAVASFTVTPELPDGLNFNNGTIFGTPNINSTLVQYNITASNNGGSDFFLLNITILEPVAILDTDQAYFELIRSEDYMNLTLNNTGGMVATWEVEPFLPAGLIFGNGTITGIPSVNASLASYTIWANNTGGSDSIIINIRILEPAAEIAYRQTDFIAVNGQGNLYISPQILGGNPETWEFEPELPEGISFNNGLISGTPAENLTTTTYTVWANNSGGVSFATINLTVNQPFYVVRYPATILVLNVSENMPVNEPLYYFDEATKTTWSIEPSLPEGLVFDAGSIYGVPKYPQPLTPYNITVTGDLVPFTVTVMIEILPERSELVIEDQRNMSKLTENPPETVFPEPEPREIAYWLFPLALIILVWLVVMLYNLKNKPEDN